MRAAVLVLLAGCGGEMLPAPDEVALVRLQEANELFERGAFAEAVPRYEFVIKHRDLVKEAYHKLARCHESLGDVPRAIEILEKARRVDRSDDYVARELARLEGLKKGN